MAQAKRSVNGGRKAGSENPANLIVPYRRTSPKTQPPYQYPPYRSTPLRSPSKPLIVLPHTLSEVTGPVYGHGDISATDDDLTRQHSGEPLGERITVTGRVMDDNGRPVPHTLLEIWQCNAAGRYTHRVDQHPAPLDPNFSGAGRTMTDDKGNYRFVTIKPGAYPWGNHPNAWRPAHIHFSLFGTAFATRLVTQMYFPNDPLFPFDPIFQSIPDEKARQRMISKFELDLTQPDWALGYRFDIVLRGPEETPFETRGKKKRERLVPLASQTVGPFFQIGLTGPRSNPRMAGSGAKGERVNLICTVFDGKGAAIPDAMIEIWQANAEGKYNHPADKQPKPIDPAFNGFGRAGTDSNGECAFETIKPGRVPSRGKVPQAPHLEVSVFARGLLKRAATRIYFAGDPANDQDPVIALVPKARRATLMAQLDSSQPGVWRFDVHLNGAKETVFFDI